MLTKEDVQFYKHIHIQTRQSFELPKHTYSVCKT